MSEYPLISVVVPTIGRSTLERTLESIIDSKYPNLEILVCANNVELIGLEKRLAKFPNEVRLVYWSKEKQFPSVCKNAGIKHTKGRYLTFLDDDDTALAGKFFKLSEFLERYITFFAAFGHYHVRDCYTNKIKNKNCGGHTDVCFKTLIKNNYIASGSIMYRNTEDVYFRDMPLGWSEDYDMNLRLISKHNFAHVAVPTYCWTQNLLSGYTSTFKKNGINWQKLTQDVVDRAKQKWGNENE